MIDSKVIAALRKAGVSSDQILDAMEYDLAEREAEKKERNRINQRNHREREKANEINGRVTDISVTAMTPMTPPSPNKKVPPHPLKELTPTPKEKDTLKGIQKEKPPSPKISDSDFEMFWSLFPGPRKREKAKCRAKIDRLLRDRRATVPEILDALRKRCGMEPDDRYAPLPMTWLNGERWEDPPAEGYEPPKQKLTQEEIERRIAEADGC